MGTLYLVATPLGNLEDITYRAVRILGQADVVAAESIPRTRALLAALGIKAKRLISCREANRGQAAEQVAAMLSAGQDVALVSDAGSPGLNDPAAAVVKRAVEGGFTVSPIAGPSAVAAAWSVSAIDHAPFIVLGFLPAKNGEKVKLLEKVKLSAWPFMFFEGPHRMLHSAQTLAELMPGRPVIVCREMTKMHEQILHSTCHQLAEDLQNGEIRGEFTVVVGAAAEDELEPVDQAFAGLPHMVAISRGMGTSQLAAFLAKEYKVPREELYKRIMALKNKN